MSRFGRRKGRQMRRRDEKVYQEQNEAAMWSQVPGIAKYGAVCVFLVMSLCCHASAPEKADVSSPIIPEPQHAEYGVEMLDVGSTVVCVKCDSENLRAQLKDIADEWGVPLSNVGLSNLRNLSITVSAIFAFLSFNCPIQTGLTPCGQNTRPAESSR